MQPSNKRLNSVSVSAIGLGIIGVMLSAPAKADFWSKHVAPIGHAVEKGAHDTGHAIEKAGQDTGHTVEKAAQDAGHTVEKAAQDAGHTVEKAAQDASHAIEKAGQDVWQFVTSPFRAIGHFFSSLIEGVKEKIGEFLSQVIKWAAIGIFAAVALAGGSKIVADIARRFSSRAPNAR
jgi:hypothetical protein